VAFLVGIALFGSVAEKSQCLVSPLRDLFAAMFFFIFKPQVRIAPMSENDFLLP
jgi:CPA2 family monovalent cation:H+ antiporter-2